MKTEEEAVDRAKVSVEGHRQEFSTEVISEFSFEGRIAAADAGSKEWPSRQRNHMCTGVVA